MEEVNALESRVAAAVNNAPFDTQFLQVDDVPAIYDCSHIKTSQEAASRETPRILCGYWRT